MLTAPLMRPRNDENPALAWEDGAFVSAEVAGSGSPAPRSQHPLNDLAPVLEGGGGGQGRAGLSRERTGAGRCALQVPEVLARVRLDGVRGVVAVRDAAEKVE